MAQIELTEQEGNALLNLLDAAIKSIGLKGANDALVLTMKVQQAFQLEKIQQNKQDGANKEGKDKASGKNPV